jgi:hypothetical protein
LSFRTGFTLISRAEFQFVDYKFDQAQKRLDLHYAFKDAEAFTETIVFPSGTRTLTVQDRDALDRAIRLYFLLAGVSYYKAAIPDKIRCLPFTLDRHTAQFCEEVYRAGLGEFAYRNNIKLRFSFVPDVEDTQKPIKLDLPHRLLVPVGGGKDSTVTIELLKKEGFDMALIASAGKSLPQPIADIMKVADLPSFHVQRFISPKLMELNAQGALNGHVPITAILSSLLVICAILYGYDTIVQSNEGSASEPNVIYDGLAVNHQYSKSFDFEKAFQAYVQDRISPSIRYFSLLRPMTETAISARFAKYCAPYFSVFRSCNTAFRQDEERRGSRWCCACPKCRFVFLALAPFMKKEDLVRIFGKNMLDDPIQEEGYRQLCGLSGHKPFECVGEIHESAKLMLFLSTHPDWQNAVIPASLGRDLKHAETAFDDGLAPLFRFSDEHQVPKIFMKVLQDEDI